MNEREREGLATFASCEQQRNKPEMRQRGMAMCRRIPACFLRPHVMRHMEAQAVLRKVAQAAAARSGYESNRREVPHMPSGANLG